MLIICHKYKKCEKPDDCCEWKSTQDPECLNMRGTVYPLRFKCETTGWSTALVKWKEIKDE